MITGLYAGSFDPPTLGHLDIINRAASFCDLLIVGIGVNTEKQPFFSSTERARLMALECAHLSQVTVLPFTGATVLFAKQQNANVLIRGLRTAADLDNERAMAEVNKANGFESMFLLTSGPLAHVSSSVVRQAFAAGLSLEGMVSPHIAECLQAHQDKEGQGSDN